MEIPSFYTCLPNITTIWCMVPEIQSETDKSFSHFGPFQPLPLNDSKNLNFEKKRKKYLEILSFYTYMFTINVDHMVCGSWNIRCNRQKFSSFCAIFCHFSHLTAWKIKILRLKKHLNILSFYKHKWQSIWWIVLQIWSATNFLSFWTVFCHFTPLTTQKIKILKKWKNLLEIRV